MPSYKAWASYIKYISSYVIERCNIYTCTYNSLNSAKIYSFSIVDDYAKWSLFRFKTILLENYRVN